METITTCVELACLWEAYVPKPGNVHPGSSFQDMSYQDFVVSARAIVPIFVRSEVLSVGELVRDSVIATQAAVGKNTNLGILLLLAPLVKAHEPTAEAIQVVLNQLTIRDASLVYQAIRLAQPGGMGQVESQDVADEPSITLLEAMQMAEGRDLIARQYAIGFHDVFTVLLPVLECYLPQKPAVGVQHAFLIGLAELGDTLIARKCGPVIAAQAQAQAWKVLEAGYPHTPASQEAFQAFDCWLRADGHRRNPGTMADLMAATLFLALARGTMPACFP